MSMLFCESLFGIVTSRLLALRLSCRITLYGLPSPMEATWDFKIKNTHLRWCLSVKFMTGLAGEVVLSLIVAFTMFAYVLLFWISLSFLSFCCFCAMASFLTGQKGASVRCKFFPGGGGGGGSFYTFFLLHGSLCECGRLGRTRYK